MSTMRIYVGTYAKYNSGNLNGAWMDLSTWDDAEDFHSACLMLHSDESDPELMFQDWEGIPDGLVTESHVDPLVFELAEMDDEALHIFTVYRSDVDQNGTVEEAQEAFRGTYDTPADYAQELVEETGGLENVPDWLKSHIDWEGVARDMGHDGTTFARVPSGVMVFVP